MANIELELVKTGHFHLHQFFETRCMLYAKFGVIFLNPL